MASIKNKKFETSKTRSHPQQALSVKMYKKLSEYKDKSVTSPQNRNRTCLWFELEAAVNIRE
jgi:hypothetical protein